MIDNTIRKIITGKDVAIVGNASSLFNKQRAIDEHEVVVRINKGFPHSQGLIGKRTDIWATSIALEKEVIDKQFNPKAILWCTPRYELMNDYLKKEAVRLDIRDWQILFDGINARPSTGFMTICYMFPIAKSITLYGFDFWKSPTSYTGVIHIGPHNPITEERVIKELLKEKGRIIL